MLIAFILSFTNFIDSINILRYYKIPIAESLTQNFYSIPAEETLSCRRPTQYAELLVPLDNGQRGILHVKSETVSFHCSRFCSLAIGHVTNNRNATNN